MRFMSPYYNIAHINTFSDPAEQYILLDTQFDADMDVDVLATAFNLDKAEFIGRRVLIDGFGNLDSARLAELFANDPNYVALVPVKNAAVLPSGAVGMAAIRSASVEATREPAKFTVVRA